MKVARPVDAPMPAALRAKAHDEESHVAEVEAGAVHELPHDPSAEEVAAGIAAADAHGAGDVDPGSVPPEDIVPGSDQEG